MSTKKDKFLYFLTKGLAPMVYGRSPIQYRKSVRMMTHEGLLEGSC